MPCVKAASYQSIDDRCVGGPATSICCRAIWACGDAVRGALGAATCPASLGPRLWLGVGWELAIGGGLRGDGRWSFRKGEGLWGRSFRIGAYCVSAAGVCSPGVHVQSVQFGDDGPQVKRNCFLFNDMERDHMTHRSRSTRSRISCGGCPDGRRIGASSRRWGRLGQSWVRRGGWPVR
jgi:hypothetical protein